MSIHYKKMLLPGAVAATVIFAFLLGLSANELGFFSRPAEAPPKSAPCASALIEITNAEDKQSAAGRVAVANSDSKKLKLPVEVDDSKLIEELIANLTEANMDGLLAIYQTLANDPASFQKRADMLKSVAKIKDMNLASQFIQRAVSCEGKGTYGTTAACFGDALLLQLWEKNAKLLEVARQEFVSTNNPRLKLCL